jgi:hypothetical protein
VERSAVSFQFSHTLLRPAPFKRRGFSAGFKSVFIDLGLGSGGGGFVTETRGETRWKCIHLRKRWGARSRNSPCVPDSVSGHLIPDSQEQAHAGLARYAETAIAGLHGQGLMRTSKEHRIL